MSVFIRYIIFINIAVFVAGCDGDENSSIAPFSAPIDSFSIGTDTLCSSSHSLVGSTQNLSTIAHNVSGTVTIIDDCTIEITNFSYDGGGPAVYFYTGFNGVYTGSSANRMSALLTGNAFSNDTLRLVLPSTVTLDDFDSISVWCVDFNANFGEVRF